MSYLTFLGTKMFGITIPNNDDQNQRPTEFLYENESCDVKKNEHQLLSSSTFSKNLVDSYAQLETDMSLSNVLITFMNSSILSI